MIRTPSPSPLPAIACFSSVDHGNSVLLLFWVRSTVKGANCLCVGLGPTVAFCSRRQLTWLSFSAHSSTYCSKFVKLTCMNHQRGMERVWLSLNCRGRGQGNKVCDKVSRNTAARAFEKLTQRRHDVRILLETKMSPACRAWTPDARDRFPPQHMVHCGESSARTISKLCWCLFKALSELEHTSNLIPIVCRSADCALIRSILGTPPL